MAGAILTAIQSVSTENADEVKKVIQQVRGRWETLSPDERQQAIAKLRELQGKLGALTDEQRTEIAMAINSLH